MNTSKVPEPKPARVVTYSRADHYIYLALAIGLFYGVGVWHGMAIQQNTFDEAVEKARQELQHRGTPAGLQLSWLYNGKVMPELTEDPNCVLYKQETRPCPLAPPTTPVQAPHCRLISTNPNGSHNWDCRKADA